MRRAVVGAGGWATLDWAVLGWGVLGTGLLYIGLPSLLVQGLGLGIIREGSMGRRELALTFDDGPHPLTTPAVLEALASAGARATFFVSLPDAQAHPGLLRRMMEEGHEVAPHCLKHRHAWIRSPWGMALEPLRAARGLESLSGRRVRLYRPPHGAYTLATLLGLRRAGLVGVHWSVEGRDWHARSTPESTVRRVLARVVPGAVVVLHDAGAGARNTVPALPELLRALRERGYRLVSVSELHEARALGWRELPRRIAGLVDDLFDAVTGVRRVAGRRDTIFRAGLTRFPFPDLTLPGGMPLERGAGVIEIHVNNPLMVDLGIRPALRQGRQDLRLLARDILGQPQWERAQAVFCVSALRPLAESLGLESHPLSPGVSRRLGLWARVLRRAYRAPGSSRPRPALSVLGIAAFLERYGSEGSGAEENGAENS